MTREEAGRSAKEKMRQAAVEQAFADGKEIEYRHHYDALWQRNPDPAWDWDKYDYRISLYQPSNSEYIPFDFSDAKDLIGKAVKIKDNDHYYLISSCFERGVYLGLTNVFYTYDKMLDHLEFKDGSPCGKEKV